MNSNNTTTLPTSRTLNWDQIKRRITEWQRRSRSRQELEGLSDSTLRDIGITRCDVQREVNKPFWMT